MTDDYVLKPPVTLCVLAGGMSRRMGDTNKLLLPYQGQPMVRHVVGQALEAACGPVWVVTGFQAAAIRHALSGLNIHFVHNPDYLEGQAASVRTAAGIDGSAALLVLLADMPQIDAALIHALSRAYDQRRHRAHNSTDYAVVRPVFQNRSGNPVLWGPGWLPRLRQLQGDEGARTLLASYTGEVTLVPVTDNAIFADVDQPADLSAFGMTLPG